MAGYYGFHVTAPTPGSLRVFFGGFPGTLVTKVHHRIVGKVARFGAGEMKRQIAKKFTLYRPGERTKRGRPKRWQTPTGAMQQAVGVKVLSPAKMRRGDKLAIAYVGARTDFTASKAVKSRIAAFKNLGFKRAPDVISIPRGRTGAVVNPVRYFHLALRGHGPGPKGLSFNATGRDFMTPTINAVTPHLQSVVNQEYPVAMTRIVDQDYNRIVNRGNQRRISV